MLCQLRHGKRQHDTRVTTLATNSKRAVRTHAFQNMVLSNYLACMLEGNRLAFAPGLLKLHRGQRIECPPALPMIASPYCRLPVDQSFTGWPNYHFIDLHVTSSLGTQWPPVCAAEHSLMCVCSCVLKRRLTNCFNYDVGRVHAGAVNVI